MRVIARFDNLANVSKRTTSVNTWLSTGRLYFFTLILLRSQWQVICGAT